MPALVGQPVGGWFSVDPAQAAVGGGTAQAGTSNIAVKIFNCTKDPATLGAALTTWNAAYYTAARLAGMSVNDMLYAVMQNQAAIAAVLP